RPARADRSDERYERHRVARRASETRCDPTAAAPDEGPRRFAFRGRASCYAARARRARSRMESWPEQIVAWHDFYVIVGSAGAGLTGLMFVVVSLGQRTFAESRDTGVRAFVTPTVVFFTSVLVIAAAMTVPHVGPATIA